MISVKLAGRLGNQMFQYVICRTIANSSGYNFFISDSLNPSNEGHHIKNYFNNLDIGVSDGNILYVYEEDFSTQKYDENIYKVSDFTELRGFFQTPKYFHHIKKDILSWFEIKNYEETKKFYDNYDINNYCVIHLRASDYKNHGHVFLNENYYICSMKIVKEKYPNIKFVIITEDISSAKSMFPEIDCYSHDNMMIDFEIINKSKITIIPNSTFSWWSAWLGNKDLVVAPNNWWNYNKPELGFYPVDIMTDEFIYV